ncbi:MAG: SRPBCC family protein [Bacteroidetes bacterium]|nr:MAG: SRPBCC family protein [Bacteroidota bacterium]
MKLLRMLMVLLGASIIPFFGVGLLKPEVRYATDIYVDIPLAETYFAFADLAGQGMWRSGLNETDTLAFGKPLVGQEVRFTGWHRGQERTFTLTMQAAQPEDTLVIETETSGQRELATVTFTPDGAGDRGTLIVYEGRMRGRTYLHRCFNAFTKGRFREDASSLLYDFKYYAEENLERRPFEEPWEEELESDLEGQGNESLEEIAEPDSLMDQELIDPKALPGGQ